MQNHFLICLRMVAIGLIVNQYIVFAQQANTDSTYSKPKRNLRGILALDGKRSFIASHPVGITGIRAGIKWKNNFRVGIGYYFLNREAREAHMSIDPQGNPFLLVHRLRFRYWALFYEPLLLKTKHWEIYVPIYFGPGKATTRRFRYNEYLNSSSRRVALLEISTGVEYRFLRYLGIGAGLGYRQILWADSNIRENLNAPIYSLRLKIFFDHLGEDLRWVYNRFYRE